MKVCVFGAGAVGGVIAGHLARAGLCDVSVVARGAHLDALRRRGLRVVSHDDDFVVDVRATDDPRELGEQDYIFVTTKAHQLDSAYALIEPLLGADTAVLPPSTGIPYWFFHGAPQPWRNRRLPLVDPGGRHWSIVDPARVIGCVHWIGAHVIDAGVVSRDGDKAGCPVGEPDGTASDRVMRLSDVLSRSGIASPVRSDIRGEIWTKAINSLCWNPVATLTMASLGGIGSSPEVVAIVRAMMNEADALAALLGIGVPYSPDKRIDLTLRAPGHRMSMLQDLEAARALEFDTLDTSFRTVRELGGLPTPTIDTVMGLMRLRARSAASPLL